MSRRVRYRCSIRQFLNRPGHHGTAAIIASVENTSRLPKDELRFGRCPRVYLNISDCSRQVALQFDLNTPAQQANSLHKIKTLVDALATFRAALEAEIALQRGHGEESDDIVELDGRR